MKFNKSKKSLNYKLIILIILIILILLLLSDNQTIRNYFIKSNFGKEILYNISINKDYDVHNCISEYIPKNSNVLIFGCGLNTYTDVLKSKLNCTVSCLDIIDQSVSNNNVIIYDGKNVPLNNNYDIVIISTVLHHISPTIEFDLLNQIKKITKRIIIVEDYMDDNVFSYIKTCTICALTNVSFINREYNFKSNKNWLLLFSKLGYSNIQTKNCGYNIYCIDF